MYLLMVQTKNQALDISCICLSLYLVSSGALVLGECGAIYDGTKEESDAYVENNSG